MANKKEAYLCISAMLRAREPKLLSREKAERMLDAATFEDAAKLLTDCGYEDLSQMDAAQIEESLEKHRAQIFDELGRFCAESRVVDLFKLRYDYHNAKVILKAEAMLLRHICRGGAAEKLEKALETCPVTVTGDKNGATCKAYTEELMKLL